MKTKILLAVLFLFSYYSYAQKKQERKLCIVFIGNSITEGKGGPNSSPPPTHAANFLREQKGITDVLFANAGKSGCTTVDFLPGIGKQFAKVTRAADTLSLRDGHQLLFSMKLGTNDSAIEGPNGAPVSKENYRKNMETIINTLLDKYPGSIVVVHHPIWYSTNTYNRSKYLQEGLERLESYIPQIDLMVKAYKTTHSGRVFKGDSKAFDHFKKNYLKLLKPENGQQGTFYLHPNEEGVAVLGKYWGKAIAKAIR
jgi:lysophospholipase L1-like esterase